jgi:hypothetical protein
MACKTSATKKPAKPAKGKKMKPGDKMVFGKLIKKKKGK